MPSPTVPTIQYGGYFLLTSLMNKGSRYMDNPLRQNFFRAGHAHAGVIVILSLVTERGRSLDFIQWQYKNASAASGAAVLAAEQRLRKSRAGQQRGLSNRGEKPLRGHRGEACSRKRAITLC
jgi:hypothetical protein